MNETNNILELLDLLYQRFDSFQTLWTIYSTVVFGILAALISFPKHLNSKVTRVILIVGFSMFTLANTGALLGVQEDRIDLLSELKTQKECGPLELITPISYFKKKESKDGPHGINSLICEKRLQSKSLIGLFHILQDLLIILLIWILPKSLVRIQLFKSVSNLKIKIRGSDLPNPVISWDQENRIWVLEESVHVGIKVKELPTPYTLQIPEKFHFDLATIPRFLWGLIAPFELSIIAPLVHDFLYIKKGRFFIDENQLIKSEQTETPLYISRLETDRIFLDHMKQEGIGTFKRYSCYYGVRWFGGFFWKEKNL
ncbi:DUF1353 domain-containing protein [uncultured Dokdonia sp.]|uniref:DUF1353 domain-containing protein n=1 Tax=uncultured Dokdonia sp. TaxID=575653 RepID=UPI00260B5F1A|nr:DUF1353 domain-containing protein [uncultured Dokdonia sp.]